MNLLAIDPGLDLTAVAAFDLERFDGEPARTTSAVLLRSLADVAEIETTPDHRLQNLAAGAQELVPELEPVLVYVEMPTIAGQYSRHGKVQRAGVNKLHMAFGAVMAGLEPTRVVELPEGPRGGKREDALDAIWLGCQALTTRVRRDLAEIS